eukprot:Gb_23521 [translate_table: standard]
MWRRNRDLVAAHVSALASLPRVSWIACSNLIGAFVGLPRYLGKHHAACVHTLQVVGHIINKIAALAETKTQNVKDTYQENLGNAFAIINLVVIPIVKINIKKSTTPNEAWDTLSNLYAGSNDARIIQLRAQLGSLKMSLGDLVVEHLQKLKEVRISWRDMEKLLETRRWLWQPSSGCHGKDPRILVLSSPVYAHKDM